MSDRKMKAEFLSVVEAEGVTGISRWSWRRWAYNGKVASVKLGKRLLIPASEIKRLVTENTRPAITGPNSSSGGNVATAPEIVL